MQFVVMAVFSVVLTQFTCDPGSNEDGHEEKGTEAPFPMCAAIRGDYHSICHLCSPTPLRRWFILVMVVYCSKSQQLKRKSLKAVSSELGIVFQSCWTQFLPVLCSAGVAGSLPDCCLLDSCLLAISMGNRLIQRLPGAFLVWGVLLGFLNA